MNKSNYKKVPIYLGIPDGFTKVEGKPKVGINGFGRIGRIALRVALQMGVEVVAINDPFIDPEYMVYMFKYDTTHGRFLGKVHCNEDSLVVDEHVMSVFKGYKPNDIPWSKAGAEYILECTGVFTEMGETEGHISAGGASKVIVATQSLDAPMFVCGGNLEQYESTMGIICNGSDATMCVVPLAKVLQENFGIREALMTTVHAISPTQKTVDGPSGKDRRGGRGAKQNIVPCPSGAAEAVGRVLPELRGRMTGVSFRVPVADVSIVDLTCKLSSPASYDDITKAIKDAADSDMKGIIGYTQEPLVSTDFIGCPYSAVLDVQAGIALNETFVKLVAWFDNEYAYSCRLMALVNYIYCRDHFLQGAGDAKKTEVAVNQQAASNEDGVREKPQTKCCGCFG